MSNNIINQEYLYFLDYASLFRLRLIKELVGIIDGKTVVDIGCGNGSVSLFLWCLGAKVCSVDISRKALQRTRDLKEINKGEFSPNLVQSEAMKLPFKEETFDIVCCLETLQFLLNKRMAIEEMARVVKTGGIGILSVPNDLRSTGKEKSGELKKDFSKTLEEVLCVRQLRLKRIVFWGFPIPELLEKMKIRDVFAALGALIETLSGNNKKGGTSFQYHALLKFYKTRIWRRAALPLILSILSISRLSLFQKSPCSDDVFLLFRKVNQSLRARDLKNVVHL